MKTLVIGLTLLAGLASANPTINYIEFAMSGAVELSYKVALSKQGNFEQPALWISRCANRDLTLAEQSATGAWIQPAQVAATREILANRAMLANEVPISGPFLATGFWQKLSVSYTYVSESEPPLVKTAKLDFPLVIINGQLSQVLSEISQQAIDLAARTPICREL